MNDRIFTETLDWLAFTVPQATVDEIGPVVGGEWFETTTGFRGYPTCWLTNQGRHGVGKLGTGAPRNAKEVHVDLSAGIVSTWDEAKIRSVLTWVFARGGHITRMDVALDDRAAGVSIAQIKQAVDAGQAVTRSQKFQVLPGPRCATARPPVTPSTSAVGRVKPCCASTTNDWNSNRKAVKKPRTMGSGGNSN